MGFHFPEPRKLDPSAADRRAFGRRLQESLQSDLGPVLDLSRGGMRVSTRRPPESEMDVTLDTFDGDLVIRARLAWTKKIGFRKFEVGLEFVDVDDQTAQRLSQISTAHQLRFRDAG